MATFQAGSLIEDALVTVTSGGTLTLTFSSPTYLQFTGSSTHTVVLPDATTIRKSKRYYVANRSTAQVTVQYDDTSVAVVVDPDTERLLVVMDVSTSNGTWDISTGTGGGGGGGGGGSISVLGDWTDYSGSVTFPACYGTTVEVEYWGKRVGDNLVARGAFQVGAPTSADATFVLPTGLTVDSSKFTQTIADPTRDARHYLGPAYALLNTGTVLDNGPTFAIFYDKETDGLYLTNSTDPGGTREFWIRPANGFINSDEVISFEFQVPILEWANSSVGTNAVNAEYEFATTFSVPNNTLTPLQIGTLIFDNTGGQYNPVTGTLTVAEDSTWSINCDVGWDVNSTGIRQLYLVKNTTDIFAIDVRAGTTTGFTYTQSNFTFALETGDTIEVVAFQDSGGALDIVFAQIALTLVARVATTDVISARYTQSSGQSIGSSSITVVDFDTLDFDSHGLVTTGAAWKLTVQSDGYYAILAHLAYTTISSANNYNIYIYKNGSLVTREFSGGKATLVVSDMLFLTMGDYIDIRTDQDTGSPVALDAASPSNGISVWKVQPTDMSTDPSPIKVIAYNTNNQSLPGGVETVLGFNGVPLDSHAAFNGVTGVFTAPRDCVVNIGSSMGFTIGPTSGYMFVRKNGVTATFVAGAWSGTNTQQPWFTLSGLIQLLSGETLEFMINPSVTTTVDTNFINGTQISIFEVR